MLIQNNNEVCLNEIQKLRLTGHLKMKHYPGIKYLAV